MTLLPTQIDAVGSASSAGGAAPPVRTQIRLGEMWIDVLTQRGALARIDELVVAREPALVVTPNVDYTVRSQRDPEFRELVRAARLVLADGMPLVWASRLLGTPLPERVTGSDLFPALCAHAAERGYRVFFLGGSPGAAETARDILVARHATLKVVGVHCPPMGFEQDATQRAAAVDAVAAARPDIVFVGLGSPKAERWIVAHQAAYGPAVSISIGVSFSFIAGDVRRAPRWMQRIGFEWLHRLLQEPGRLWKRYLVDGWRFVPVVWRTWRVPRAHRVRNTT